MPDYPTFIPNAGACLVSAQALSGKYPVRWMSRKQSQAPADNGWRILSIADTPDYLNTPGNMVVADYNAICAVEPALIGIWDFPIGSELMLADEAGRLFIVDTLTNREVPPENYYVPPQFRA